MKTRWAPDSQNQNYLNILSKNSKNNPLYLPDQSIKNFEPSLTFRSRKSLNPNISNSKISSKKKQKNYKMNGSAIKSQKSSNKSLKMNSSKKKINSKKKETKNFFLRTPSV